ncbi:barrier-to-autointegration factor-like [Mytilus galloprovincialis]|uniref:barrier-to-autointegration factor-like n=1 Tax=Mytilus galloprovincialis TaxID=29158 RepID=UPI003F7B666B
MMSSMMIASQISQAVNCDPMTNLQTATIINEIINSQVHQRLVNEPIGLKLVTAFPGIGPITAVYFNNDNIYKASQILGYFLFMQRDAGKFMTWLSTYGCNKGQQQAIYNAVEEYVQRHLF